MTCNLRCLPWVALGCLSRAQSRPVLHMNSPNERVTCLAASFPAYRHCCRPCSRRAFLFRPRCTARLQLPGNKHSELTGTAGHGGGNAELVMAQLRPPGMSSVSSAVLQWAAGGRTQPALLLKGCLPSTQLFPVHAGIHGWHGCGCRWRRLGREAPATVHDDRACASVPAQRKWIAIR